MIERDFDVPFVAGLALREKQIQQNYRPIICVHKWFARRPGSLFRGLLLSEFAGGDLREVYYKTNKLAGVRVADPFMGGGTPLLEANRLGCDVVGYDVNPMAYWIVREEIRSLDLDDYAEAAGQLRRYLLGEIGELYRTRCVHCGAEDAVVKYFLWVKVQACRNCGADVALLPGKVVAKNRRHPNYVFVCGKCGALTEAESRDAASRCAACDEPFAAAASARRNRFECPHCGFIGSYPDPDGGPPRHRMFAIEYYCPECKPDHKGRFFKAPDEQDLGRFATAEHRYSGMDATFVPEEQIPPGDESDRLRRWGYRHYREMFNARQLLGLELSCRFIAAFSNARIRDALATNLSDLLRYQNMLCRYDTMALKSLDIFSVHGFPVGLVQCESNILGIEDPERGGCIGSGGWCNMIHKFTKAKSYCLKPYEVRHEDGRRTKVALPGEWIGESRGGRDRELRQVDISCADATQKPLPPNSLDGVFTDPPYFGNVQYAELMDFCYVWLRRLVPKGTPGFEGVSTRTPGELTANVSMDRGIEHFAEGLSRAFCHMARALKPGTPLVFTYHHNELAAYYPVAAAILDAGLTCSASLPCPAEMGASIHISGTSSSIIDTVFVCRSTGSVPRRWLPEQAEGVAGLVRADIAALEDGGVRPTAGDIRCIIHGHLVRLCMWSLRPQWDPTWATKQRLDKVGLWTASFGGVEVVERHLAGLLETVPARQGARVEEVETPYGAQDAQVPF